MAEALVLGSGTSTGVPVLGIEYPAEFLANPKNHRTRTSILIQSEGKNLLVDPTPDMRTQLLRENILDVNAVLITHTHADHIMGMDDLRSFCLKLKSAMPVYAREDHAEDIRRIFPYAFWDFPPGIEVPRFDLLGMPDRFEFSGLEIETLEVVHGSLPVIAIRTGGFAYVTDVSEIPQGAWSKLQGLDTLVLDAVRIKPHPNHFHFDRAIEVAQELAARQTFFTHLSHDFDHDITNASLPSNIQLAFDGQRITI